MMSPISLWEMVLLARATKSAVELAIWVTRRSTVMLAHFHRANEHRRHERCDQCEFNGGHTARVGPPGGEKPPHERSYAVGRAARGDGLSRTAAGHDLIHGGESQL
jgi:hypothetical protein